MFIILIQLLQILYVIWRNDIVFEKCKKNTKHIYKIWDEWLRDLRGE